MSIKLARHVEVHSSELAKWIDQQGADVWWNVDGDPVLTARLDFPCPGDELADLLRRVDRVLLIQDPKNRQDTVGQTIAAEDLDAFTVRLGNTVPHEGKKPDWFDDRTFYCCWKNTTDEWLLSEDKETSKSSQQDSVTPRTRG